MDKNALYIVATPIGNLGDMTPRAIEVLRHVDLIAAEDTRHSKKLLQHFAINTPMVALHDHNERQQAVSLIERLGSGLSIALISDAGTPLVSDPGCHLVSAVRSAGFKVMPVPGACAVIAALSASGLPSDRFFFEGFLPAKSKQRRERLSELGGLPHTWIVYESPHRIMSSMNDLLAVLGGERNMVVARELTKTFETIYSGTVADVCDWMSADDNQQRGEFVLLVGPEVKHVDSEAIPEEASRTLDILLEELSVKQASQLAAKITGIRKKQLYELALQRKQG